MCPWRRNRPAPQRLDAVGVLDDLDRRRNRRWRRFDHLDYRRRRLDLRWRRRALRRLRQRNYRQPGEYDRIRILTSNHRFSILSLFKSFQFPVVLDAAPMPARPAVHGSRRELAYAKPGSCRFIEPPMAGRASTLLSSTLPSTSIRKVNVTRPVSLARIEAAGSGLRAASRVHHSRVLAAVPARRRWNRHRRRRRHHRRDCRGHCTGTCICTSGDMNGAGASQAGWRRGAAAALAAALHLLDDLVSAAREPPRDLARQAVDQGVDQEHVENPTATSAVSRLLEDWGCA